MHEPVIEIVNKITDQGGKVRRQGKEFKATCPAHEDAKASLQIGYGEKGAVLHCHAGCTTQMIMDKLGLPLEFMFADYGEKKSQADREQALATDASLRKAARGAEATYFYEDENGMVLYRVERHPAKKFIQARPDPHHPGQWLYNLGDVRRVLYHLPNLKGAAKQGDTVYVVEGEKDVHRLEANGLVATTNPGGAGKFKREYAEFLSGAHVVILPDNDPTGHEHARVVTEYLKDVARSIKTIELPGLPPKGDVDDWFHAGEVITGLQRMFGVPANGPLSELFAIEGQTEPQYTNRPVIFDAYSLMKEQFPEVVMAVPGIVAEGCTFLVGSPKIGKSWMALGLGLAVAQGGMALGTIPVEKGPVLYLSLEDTPRRLQRRLQVMIGSQDGPPELEFACNWPRLNAGGLDQLEDWLKDNSDARLVLIDTWAKVKAAIGDRESMYQADYSAVSAIKSLADTYGTAIVLVHHTRKAGDGDPLNTVAGSTGLTGAADATVILTRPRGAEEGHLYVTGRDVEESKSIVSFDGQVGSWTWLGEADDVEETRIEDQVTKLLKEADGAMGPKEVAEELNIKEGTSKWLLAKLAQEGKIKRISRGKYTVDDGTNPTPPNGKGTTTPTKVVPSTTQQAIPGTGGKPMKQGPAVVGGTPTGGDDEEDDDGDMGEFEQEFGGVDDEEEEDDA